MSLTGNYVDASTAEKWGLVNRVVPHEALLETVHGWQATSGQMIKLGCARCSRLILGRRRQPSPTAGNEASMGTEWLKNSDFRPEKVAQRRVDIQNRGRAQQNP